MPIDHPAAAYATQSTVTDPGAFASCLNRVADDLSAIRDVARQLVFHYRADGDWADHAFAPERIEEIDSRYADVMFRRLFAHGDAPLTKPRPPDQRLVGCCRDFTVFLLAMARHKGIPARMRVGFATYFVPDWNLDHAVAEVWDAVEQRWRLVDAELDTGHVDPRDGSVIDPLDLPRDRFIVGPSAWLACRAETLDPETFVVDPDVDIPATRGWPFLLHNLIHDLAAINRHEMVLWDAWGLMECDEPMSLDDLVMLDHTAAAMLDPRSDTARLAGLVDRDGFRVPDQVTSYTDAAREPVTVTMRP